MSTDRRLAQRKARVPVRQLCQVLRVAPAAYYAWLRRQQPSRPGKWPCTATRFKDILARNGAVHRMSRRGNCYDNAHAASFWSRFKAEPPDGGFPGLTEAKLETSHHIAYDNAERRHSALGATAHPTPSNPNSKPRPNSVRLSLTTSWC